MIKALARFTNGEISFIYKYVDDVIGGIDESSLIDIQDGIEKSLGIKLQMCRENDENEVDYLQMKIRRQTDNYNLIDIRWYQKEYSSKSILNFHSFHPWRMKSDVVVEFIRNALKISSKIHWEEVTDVLRKVLQNSNYKRGYINGCISRIIMEMNSGRTIKKEQTKTDTIFLPCPYYPGAIGFIRKSIKKMGIENVSIAPKLISNNRNDIFSNMKDRRELNCLKNASFIIECSDCSFSCMYVDVPRRRRLLYI